MPSELVHLTVTDSIATVTLNRPDKLNALNGEMLARLDGKMISLSDFRGKRVVINSWASW